MLFIHYLDIVYNDGLHRYFSVDINEALLIVHLVEFTKICFSYTGTETLLSFNGTDTSSLGYLAKAAYEDIFTNSKISTMSITIVNGQLIDEYYLNKVYIMLS